MGEVSFAERFLELLADDRPLSDGAGMVTGMVTGTSLTMDGGWTAQ